MSWFYRHCIRPILFTQDAECAHDFTLKILSRASRSRAACAAADNFFSAPELPVEVFGLKFSNPVGLAAGMDKFAAAVPIWEKLGFGFCELGGVTRRAQPGNSPPRMFRAVADGGIVNRMGLNNPGVEALAQKLVEWKRAGRWPRHPVGINLGKSKTTPLESTAEDYSESFRILRELADFFVLNVSSPNTPGLRQLQDKTALDEILLALKEMQSSDKPQATSDKKTADKSRDQRPFTCHKPILVKIAPDLSFEALDEILELAAERNVSGIVATNTTVSRPQTNDSTLQSIYSEAGGLSGRPLRARSTEIVRHIFKQTRGQLPILGVGGIFNADDAWEKIAAGATLIQIYTGLVFGGPGLAKKIVAGLIQRMKNEGVRDLKEIVGLEHKL